MNKFLLAALVAAGAAFSGAAQAQPATINVVSFSVPNNINANISVYKSGTGYVTTGGSGGENVLSGQVQLVTTNPTGTLLAWCTDIYDVLHAGTFNLTTLTNGGGTIASTLSATTVNRLGYLMNNYNLTSVDASHAGHTTALNELSSATQLAIWAVEYVSLGYTVTYLSADSALNGAHGLVQDLIDLANGTAGAAFSSQVNEYASAPGQGANQNQSFLGNGGFTGNVTSVPEPASMLLLGAGIAGLAAVRRRLRRG